jgi:hypothetical protein
MYAHVPLHAAPAQFRAVGVLHFLQNPTGKLFQSSLVTFGHFWSLSPARALNHLLSTFQFSHTDHTGFHTDFGPIPVAITFQVILSNQR